jgi:hypothetical protein
MDDIFIRVFIRFYLRYMKITLALVELINLARSIGGMSGSVISGEIMKSLGGAMRLSCLARNMHACISVEDAGHAAARRQAALRT